MGDERERWDIAKQDEYFIVGDRPVTFVQLADGGMDVQAYDWDTGGFVRDMSYLTRCIFGHGDIDVVDRVTFEAHVAALRARRPG